MRVIIGVIKNAPPNNRKIPFYIEKTMLGITTSLYVVIIPIIGGDTFVTTARRSVAHPNKSRLQPPATLGYRVISSPS